MCKWSTRTSRPTFKRIWASSSINLSDRMSFYKTQIKTNTTTSRRPPWRKALTSCSTLSSKIKTPLTINQTISCPKCFPNKTKNNVWLSKTSSSRHKSTNWQNSLTKFYKKTETRKRNLALMSLSKKTNWSEIKDSKLRSSNYRLWNSRIRSLWPKDN